MRIFARIGVPTLLVVLGLVQSANAQRRVITNDDLPAVPAAPSAPPAAAAGQSAPNAPALGATESAASTPAENENARRAAEAQKLITRLTEIRAALGEASDIFFDKIREGTAAQPTVNKWNQVRDNLVLASDELGLFINEARRNLPPPSAPANPARTPN